MRFATLAVIGWFTFESVHAALAQERIPVRSLAPASAVSVESFGAILSVRAVAGGRVLLSDAGHRRLMMLDSALRVTRVVLDSVAGTPNYYGARGAPLIAYVGDSTVTFDFQAGTLLLIDPNGQVARAMAVPDARAISAMAGSAAWVDPLGRLTYRGVGRSGLGGAGRSPLLVTMDDDGLKSNADSVPLLRANLQERTTDTLAALKNFHARRVAIDSSSGMRAIVQYSNPLQNGDEWAMLADGTVAIVRGHDYHIDFITRSGEHRSAAKLPFAWKQIEPSEKQRILDSARLRDSTDRLSRTNTVAGLPTRSTTPPMGTARNGRGGGAGGGAEVTPGFVPGARSMFVSANELPDYYPPIRSGAVRADLDGNLWILPTTSSASRNGELVYDVVNGKGELHERVRVPLGKVIAGFGPRGVVYLMSGSLADGFRLERTRIDR